MSPPVMTPVKSVSEGGLVTLRCSVPVPCSILPPSLTWLPQNNTWQESTQIRQEIDGRMVMTSTQTFMASAEHHNQVVGCSVSYPLSKGGSTEPSATTQRLSIQYAPRSTAVSVSMSGPVSEGSTVALACSSDANPPVSRYTWYRAHSGQLTKEAEGELLILEFRQTDSGLYQCQAQNQRGSQRSTFVSLEVNSSYTGSSDSASITPYIISVVVLVLFVLTLAVHVYLYQSLSGRLKKIELTRESTYADLRTSSVSADYDQLQLNKPRQPKSKSSLDSGNYENIKDLTIQSQPQPKQI